MTGLRKVHRCGTLTLDTEERLAQKEYLRPTLKDLGRMDLVRAKSLGGADGGPNNKKNPQQP
jgi:hypothetical protein